LNNYIKMICRSSSANGLFIRRLISKTI